MNNLIVHRLHSQCNCMKYATFDKNKSNLFIAVNSKTQSIKFSSYAKIYKFQCKREGFVKLTKFQRNTIADCGNKNGVPSTVELVSRYIVHCVSHISSKYLKFCIHIVYPFVCTYMLIFREEFSKKLPRRLTAHKPPTWVQITHLYAVSYALFYNSLSLVDNRKLFLKKVNLIQLLISSWIRN